MQLTISCKDTKIMFMIKKVLSARRPFRCAAGLFLAVSFLLLGNGMVSAGEHLCRSFADQPVKTARMATAACCCCAGEKSEPCSTGLTPACDQQKAGAAPVSASNAQGPAFSVSPAFAQVTPPSFNKEERTLPVPGREIVYLIRLNLLC